MLTPKDAFLQFNEDNTGRMTFDQFNKFIIRLSMLARDPTPSFAIIKDIFDFIDIRRDGIIDLNEWMQTFRGVEVCLLPPPILIPKNYEVATQNVATYKRNTKSAAHLPRVKPAIKRKINFAAWEISKDYDKVIKAIGRNRKRILGIFAHLEKKRRKIDYNTARKVIGDVLRRTNIRVKKEHWPLLIKFAEKQGVIDYEFLLEIYRDRVARLDAPT